MGKYWVFLITFALPLLTLSSFVMASDDKISRQSLRDLKGIYVSVEKLTPEIEKDGLTSNNIGKDVESMLRKAKIKTLSKGEWFDVTGSPYLYVNANVLKLPDTKEYIYSVNIALKQNVYPVREPIEILGAATWSVGGIIGITPSLDKIRASVREQVGKFIKAYLSVNPS
ncbi:MAG: hypothetical protein KKD92_15520 [Proteobacteria bacterium]|nr:hypothetical protein [Pseudomonadota bacterium]